ncbi:MAG: ATP-dependent Clp protease adaptor ClpS [Pyrinomonadaceae bacterium]|nr:ATP-dependent Clp protease adaptor ClpS [Phycisphaerales bacterium]
MDETTLRSSREPKSAPDKRMGGSPCFRPLPQFRVLLHNHDLVELSYVVGSIVQLTCLPTARAYVVAMTAYTQGVALITITHRERAELFQLQFRNKGLIVTIEATQ